MQTIKFVRLSLVITLALGSIFLHGCDTRRGSHRHPGVDIATQQLSGYKASGIYADKVNLANPYRSRTNYRRCIDGNMIHLMSTHCSEDYILGFEESASDQLLGAMSGQDRTTALAIIAEDAQYMLEHSKDPAAVEYANRIGAEALRQLQQLVTTHDVTANTETAQRLAQARAAALKMLREGQVGDDW